MKGSTVKGRGCCKERGGSIKGVPSKGDSVKGGVVMKEVLCRVQGLSVPFACVGSGDPVRVTSVHNEYTGYLLKHLLLRHMYNLPLLVYRDKGTPPK